MLPAAARASMNGCLVNAASAQLSSIPTTTPPRNLSVQRPKGGDPKGGCCQCSAPLPVFQREPGFYRAVSEHSLGREEVYVQPGGPLKEDTSATDRHTMRGRSSTHRRVFSTL